MQKRLHPEVEPDPIVARIGPWSGGPRFGLGGGGLARRVRGHVVTDPISHLHGRTSLAVLPFLPKAPGGVDGLPEELLRGHLPGSAEGFDVENELFHGAQYGV